MPTNRPLRVFLCHSSNDKPAVRELYQQLHTEPWIQPWLDEEELYPGQAWNLEIEKAVEASDAILGCLTKGSINKEGYVQRELRIVLDLADYKPEGTLFIIPVRLEECDPPRRLRPWQYADYFAGSRDRAFQRLLVSLKRRAEALGLQFDTPATRSEEKSKEHLPKPTEPKTILGEPQRGAVIASSLKVEKIPAQVTTEEKSSDFDQFEHPTKEWIAANRLTLSTGMEFRRVPVGQFLMGSKTDDKQAFDDEKPQHTVDIPYDYWMARFPVTNELYNAYAKSKGIKHPVDGWEKIKDHPVTYVKWTDAMAYTTCPVSMMEMKIAGTR